MKWEELYKNVTELDNDELNELKENYYYDILDENAQYNYPAEIPDQVIFEHYKHVSFCEEDFFCNV